MKEKRINPVSPNQNSCLDYWAGSRLKRTQAVGFNLQNLRTFIQLTMTQRCKSYEDYSSACHCEEILEHDGGTARLAGTVLAAHVLVQIVFSSRLVPVRTVCWIYGLLHCNPVSQRPLDLGRRPSPFSLSHSLNFHSFNNLHSFHPVVLCFSLSQWPLL